MKIIYEFFDKLCDVVISEVSFLETIVLVIILVINFLFYLFNL